MKIERKELFRALVGSHNYNLNTESSDRDYKVFTLPTFDDLYLGNQYSKSIIGETEDLDIHDIRKVSNLWWKSNVNFVEVLFSKEIILNKNISIEALILLNEIFEMKEEIAKMNIPYLYNACFGMYITKMKQVKKGTEGTKHIVEQFGYDTKQALHAIRILDFLRRFANSNFQDFEGSITYKEEEPYYKFLLDVKEGKFKLEVIHDLINTIVNDLEKNYKELYMNTKPNNETNQKLINLVKQIVRIELV